METTRERSRTTATRIGHHGHEENGQGEDLDGRDDGTTRRIEPFSPTLARGPQTRCATHAHRRTGCIHEGGVPNPRGETPRSPAHRVVF